MSSTVHSHEYSLNQRDQLTDDTPLSDQCDSNLPMAVLRGVKNEIQQVSIKNCSNYVAPSDKWGRMKRELCHQMIETPMIVATTNCKPLDYSSWRECAPRIWVSWEEQQGCRSKPRPRYPTSFSISKLPTGANCVGTKNLLSSRLSVFIWNPNRSTSEGLPPLLVQLFISTTRRCQYILG